MLGPTADPVKWLSGSPVNRLIPQILDRNLWWGILLFGDGRNLLRSARLLLIWSAFLACWAGLFAQDRHELRLKFSFPSEKEAQSQALLYQASYIESGPKGRFYVCDIKAHEILAFDSQGSFVRRFGRQGQGPGEFNNPRRLIAWKNLLAVYDSGNSRIQYFDESGEFVKSITLLQRYSDFVIAADGTVYASRIRAGGPGEFIDAVGDDGRVLFTFGNPPRSMSGGKDVRPNAFITKLALNSAGELGVAFWLYPFVQRYSLKGELLLETELTYKPMQEKARRNRNSERTSPSGPRLMASIIESIRPSEAGFYVLHKDPGIEILEFGEKGDLLRIYSTVQPPEYYPMDFLVREENGSKVFYLLQVSPENRIDVFVEK